MSSSPPAPSATAAKHQQSEPRRFPAPCWTHEETVALIGAYRDKWYSLRRRNLRTADWDAVADEVNSRCPHQPLLKISAQCRHKMEKLRKRYRAEKQKKVAAPFSGGMSSSSWVYFDLIDAMECGSSVPGGSGPDLTARKEGSSKGGSFGVREMGFGGIDEGIKEKVRVNGQLGCSLNEAMVVYGGSRGKMGGVPVKFKLKNHGASSSMDYDTNMNMVGLDNDDEDDDDEDEEEGDVSLVNVGNGNYGSNKGFHGKSFGSRSNEFERSGGKDSGGFDSRVMNGVWKKTAAGEGVGRGGGDGGKRGMDLLASEMVASVKILVDGFMKMEKMKMDMVREMERTRMEMEMKRSEILLESQQQIVNAFIEGMIEKRKKKKAKVNQMGENNKS